MKIYFNNETINLFHAPFLHTKGDTYVYFEKANIIHSGDIFITLNGFPPFHHSFDGYMDALDLLIEKCDDNTIVIPGHGPISDKEGVINFKNVLLKAHDIIIKLQKEGKSYEEIVKTDPLVGLLKGKKYITDEYFIYSVYYGSW